MVGSVKALELLDRGEAHDSVARAIHLKVSPLSSSPRVMILPLQLISNSKSTGVGNPYQEEDGGSNSCDVEQDPSSSRSVWNCLIDLLLPAPPLLAPCSFTFRRVISPPLSGPLLCHDKPAANLRETSAFQFRGQGE
eukprot:341565-Hanusia_phi.AAC.1